MASTIRGSKLARSENSNSHFQAAHIKKSHKLSFNNSSAVLSQELDDETSLLRLFATQDCWIAIGNAPTASVAAASGTDNVAFIAGGIYEFIGVPSGITLPQVSVIGDSASGVLHVMECL